MQQCNEGGQLAALVTCCVDQPMRRSADAWICRRDQFESLVYAYTSNIPAAPIPPPMHMVTMP